MAYEKYWSVDLPGLTESGAAELVNRADEFGVPDGGDVVDPHTFLSLHLDRQTVEAMVESLRSGVAREPEVATSLTGVLEEWLDTSQ